MAITKCVRCDTVFHKVRSPVCLNCQDAEDRDQELVRDTLAVHSDYTIEQVAEATGVSESCIRRMLEAGTIANVSLAHGYTCGRCGAPAMSASKRLCQTCLSKLDQQVAKVRRSAQFTEPLTRESARMEAREALETKRR